LGIQKSLNHYIRGFRGGGVGSVGKLQKKNQGGNIPYGMMSRKKQHSNNSSYRGAGVLIMGSNPFSERAPTGSYHCEKPLE